MINEVSEVQRKRALNQIWNGARSHAFSPDFKAYDSEGRADIYWNSIIGAVRYQYDYPQIEAVFRAFEQYEDSSVYESLFWLGLENSVYGREEGDRPALAELRHDYAESFLRLYETKESDRLYEAMATGHFKRVLGRDPGLSAYESKLLDELEFSPEMTTEDIVERTQELFMRWFQIRTEERRQEKHRIPPSIFGKKKGSGKARYRRFGIGFADHPDNIYGGGHAGEKQEENELKTKLSAAELREFMTSKYGKSIFTPREVSEIERRLCTGNHLGCCLHFTNGEEYSGTIFNGFEALQKQREARQIEKNRQFYKDNFARNNAAIAKLTSQVQNSVLMHLQPVEVKSGGGRLCGSRAWRALKLDDGKIFTRTEQDDAGSLSVDILLDASTSQKHRQETVSSQGYMIAESLTRCSIPCRVMSFCSMTGYTVLRIFRDYSEPNNNKKIFEYVSNGCNRDGLAIRAAHHLMSQSHYEHRILIILSDVKPNDVLKIRSAGDELIPYEQQAGLVDTSLEVRRARADGIAVACVFTGDDEDVPSAKMVYGRDFARIQSLDKLADAVGLLIRNQIKNI